MLALKDLQVTAHFCTFIAEKEAFIGHGVKSMGNLDRCISSIVEYEEEMDEKWNGFRFERMKEREVENMRLLLKQEEGGYFYFYFFNILIFYFLFF